MRRALVAFSESPALVWWAIVAWTLAVVIAVVAALPGDGWPWTWLTG
ncbi:hypothetical protein [Mycolicibacterium vanbaalenii]|nr:hypothetical protein [Mycolicibacterium vanbaalenii]